MYTRDGPDIRLFIYIRYSAGYQILYLLAGYLGYQGHEKGIRDILGKNWVKEIEHFVCNRKKKRKL